MSCSFVEVVGGEGEAEGETLGCHAGEDVEWQHTPQLPVFDALPDIELGEFVGGIEIRGGINNHASVCVASFRLVEEPGFIWTRGQPKWCDECDDNCD